MNKFAWILTGIFTLSLLYTTSDAHEWQAKWINSQHQQNKTNSWTIFHKTISLGEDFSEATIHIAVDSKYWLWINGQMVVFEGGLKRGPNNHDTYYDQLNVSKYLRRGENKIAILTWYFGKDGFSHHSSGKAGLLFELFTDGQLKLISDRSWFAHPHPAFLYSFEGLQPNYRLPESNIVFDARLNSEAFTSVNYSPSKRNTVFEVGSAGIQPWNNLIKRPIPLWKNYGLTSYPSAPGMPFISEGDTIKCKLPYNAQITPYLRVKAKAGLTIEMLTDNYFGGGATNLRAVYITKNGEQEFESPGWINGHEMYYIIPPGIEILDLKYRETGYDTDFAGAFESPDPQLNTLWKKAQRTLYINMRDTYMDCPERERAQWWGDVVNQMSESFYSLCPASHLLARKGMLELIAWQKDDSTLFAPVPAGNWGNELPMQMLNSVGYYGFWTYLMYTGDTTTIRQVLPGVKKYLSIWKIDENGQVDNRRGGWTWGDWGINKDMPVLYNTWYAIACKGYGLMAQCIGKNEEYQWAQNRIAEIGKNFNNMFWTGTEYRSPDYQGETDDRANALAVLAGFAKPDQYPLLKKVLDKNRHASPFMEKYVLEALFSMGYDEFALTRMKERFQPMIESELTTLWEGWGIGTEGYGGGTYNHGWSGGGLTMLSKYVAGIKPLKPGFEEVEFRPAMGGLKQSKARVSTVKGVIEVENDLITPHIFTQKINSPKDMEISICFPKTIKKIRSISINGQPADRKILGKIRSEHGMRMPGGNYEIVIRY